MFFGGALLVGIERIAESAHYVSDVVAAALLGILAFKLALRIHTSVLQHLERSVKLSKPAAGATTAARAR